ncbi:pilus assembly protein PilP [Sapientia aquatica]|jgi:type IV pilus assembly protein PilP|uniref:Pilus assembly protein PilP n=1 Tax=Sapientia aquatica TaxID=1549640 RepID=A0A4R5W3D9_9BURK|nr:pilus assembly protein PilP [Sapientia aquatica]TDK65928.1 pilus assembly protein PilP [Sapientia aquatica]
MKKLLGVMLLPLGLAACGDSSVQEVQQWMDKTKQETRPSIPKLKEPKDFIPFTYDKKGEIDPFSPVKLQSALAKMNPGSAHGIKPDMDRRREALEYVPLDALKMVGTLTSGSAHYALLQADGKGVTQVKAGNYVGQNFGLITKVNDDSVEIKEIVLDSGGDWIERLTKLELQETQK